MSSNRQPCPFAMAKIKLYLLSSTLLMFVSLVVIGALLTIVLSETLDDLEFGNIVNLMVLFAIPALLTIVVFVTAFGAIRFSFDEDNPSIKRMNTALYFQLVCFVGSIIGSIGSIIIK
jgi:hypothetical protein